MDGFTVIYFDNDCCETEVELEADDAAAALGLVLDEYDDIAPDSPFAVMNAVPPGGKAAIGPSPRDDDADALGAVPLQVSPEAEADALELLARILGGTGCDLEG